MRNIHEDIKAMNEIKTAYDAAEKTGNKYIMDALRNAYHALENEMNLAGLAYRDLVNMFEVMTDKQREYIDVERIFVKPAALVETMKAQGIERFTYSAASTAATREIFEFVQAGCSIEGMTEIKDSYGVYGTNEWTMKPAFIIKVN